MMASVPFTGISLALGRAIRLATNSLRHTAGKDVRLFRSTFLQPIARRFSASIACASAWNAPHSPLFGPNATMPSRGYATESEARKLYRSMEATQDGRRLCVSWDDGEESTYHAVWLRHNCRCPKCWDDGYAAPLVYFDYLRNVEITATELEDDTLTVKFGYSNSTEEHIGTYPLHFLKKYSYSPRALLRKRVGDKPVVANHLPKVSYLDLLADEKHLWMWMKNLNLYGVCLVTDMPCIENEVLKLTGLVGGSHATMFGETFKVLVENNPDDIAYSVNALPYHCDLSGWSEYPPGLQILHCIIFKGNVEGGETLVADVVPVLEELREKYPKQFDILCTLPASFQRQTVLRERGKVSMERQKPHIILDSHGEVTTFNLHPNSEAPLSISEDQVEEYYDAYCLLQELLVSSKYQHKVRLQPGEALTFNNRRCVHGRNAFKLNGGQRYLQGTYINGDDLKGAMRLLAEKYEPNFILKRTFNLDPL